MPVNRREGGGHAQALKLSGSPAGTCGEKEVSRASFARTQGPSHLSLDTLSFKLGHFFNQTNSPTLSPVVSRGKVWPLFKRERDCFSSSRKKMPFFAGVSVYGGGYQGGPKRKRGRHVGTDGSCFLVC